MDSYIVIMECLETRYQIDFELGEDDTISCLQVALWQMQEPVILNEQWTCHTSKHCTVTDGHTQAIDRARLLLLRTLCKRVELDCVEVFVLGGALYCMILVGVTCG